MLYLKNKATTLDVANYTVIIPKICVGNSAQLACDLLISSKKLKRIGSLSHAALIPMYGPSAFQHEPNERAAACELYASSEEKLLVTQIRVPLIKRHAQSFQTDLVKLLQPAGRVLILSGSLSFERVDAGDSPWGYCASEIFKSTHAAQMGKVSWHEQESQIGNAPYLFKAFEEKQVPVMKLYQCMQRDEPYTPPSMILRELNEWGDNFLKLRRGIAGNLNLTIPKSWSLLFGNDVTASLY